MAKSSRQHINEWVCTCSNGILLTKACGRSLQYRGGLVGSAVGGRSHIKVTEEAK